MGLPNEKFEKQPLALITNRVEENENRPRPVRRKVTGISGVRLKVTSPSLLDKELVDSSEPKPFLAMIHYRYLPVIFPGDLKNEIEQLESFFGVQKNHRYEGTAIHDQTLVATITHKVNLRPQNAQGFQKALTDIFQRYQVEVVDNKIYQL